MDKDIHQISRIFKDVMTIRRASISMQEGRPVHQVNCYEEGWDLDEDQIYGLQQYVNLPNPEETQALFRKNRTLSRASGKRYHHRYRQPS